MTSCISYKHLAKCLEQSKTPLNNAASGSFFLLPLPILLLLFLFLLFTPLLFHLLSPFLSPSLSSSLPPPHYRKEQILFSFTSKNTLLTPPLNWKNLFSITLVHVFQIVFHRTLVVTESFATHQINTHACFVFPSPFTVKWGHATNYGPWAFSRSDLCIILGQSSKDWMLILYVLSSSAVANSGVIHWDGHKAVESSLDWVSQWRFGTELLANPHLTVFSWFMKRA